MYITCPKQFKPLKVPTVINSIVVVSVLTYYVLFHYLQMDV